MGNLETNYASTILERSKQASPTDEVPEAGAGAFVPGVKVAGPSWVKKVNTRISGPEWMSK